MASWAASCDGGLSGWRSLARGGGARGAVGALSLRLPEGLPMMKSAIALLVAALGGVAADAPPGYRIFVSSESGDVVTQLTWDGTTFRTVKVVPVGIMPDDIDGPHNVTISPDGKYWYVTIAHGTPYVTLGKMAGDGHSRVGRAPVELFPTTISLAPDGELAFVANSDFHGDHPRMNVVSIIYTPQMLTLTNLRACDMPHGVKVNHAGTKVYVTCMNSDEVLEIDRAALAITRRHKTGPGMLPQPVPMKMGHSGAEGATLHDACMPTFVSVSLDDTRLYVACNHSDELMVLDAATLDLGKAVATRHRGYNVQASPRRDRL